MEKLNEIYTFAKYHDVVIYITFNRTDGIRIDMEDCPFRRSLYLSEQELKYNKVDILTVLDMMLKELKKKEEENYES